MVSFVFESIILQFGLTYIPYHPVQMVVYLKFVVAAVQAVVPLVFVWLPLIERKVPAERRSKIFFLKFGEK